MEKPLVKVAVPQAASEKLEPISNGFQRTLCSGRRDTLRMQPAEDLGVSLDESLGIRLVRSMRLGRPKIHQRSGQVQTTYGESKACGCNEVHADGKSQH